MSSLVSIALCTYNGEQFIREQLNSVLNQSYGNLEIVIVDDASTDNTYRILTEYKKEDKRIRLYQNENNLGMQGNFQRTISLCTGEFISICDQDDIWNHNKISHLIDRIGDNLLIYHDSSFIDEEGKPNGKTLGSFHRFISGQKTNSLLYQNCVSGHALLFRKDLLLHTSPFPTAIYYDWWLAYTAACTSLITFTRAPLVQYRIHSRSYTKVNPEDNTDKRIKQLGCFLKHPLTPNRTRQLILQLIEGYSIKKEACFSWPLLITLLGRMNSLFYIRKRSAFSRLKHILKECKN